MTNLDTEKIYQDLDKTNILQNFRDFPDQLQNAWEAASKIPIPATYLKTRDVLLVGMGGSGIGGGIIQKLSEETCPVPVRVHRDTTALRSIGPDTLVIASSYSGETEETLAVFEHAAKAGAKLVNIGMDQTLASLGRKYRSTAFIVNYGAQTRAAFGYMMTPLVYIFSKLGWIGTNASEIQETIVLLRSLDAKLHPGFPTHQNQAKQLAVRLQNRFVIVVGSGPMAEVARRFSQDVAENAKQFAAHFEIPEMQHNALSSFDFPATLKEHMRVLLLQSRYAQERNRLRESFIGQTLQRKRIPYETIFMHPSAGAVGEIYLTVFYSAMTTYYMGIQNGVDPANVELQTRAKLELKEE